ncbi:MAG: DNA replication/repair protein RecF [Lentisphaerae bacterium]|jgi:DNA replication and repair protein RecF|nr:DNA replication and repair protein RecF [Victivallaceae bacterium]MDD3116497.1 DNA replication and repair protein RecF [Victivallaceae bacterium]MDD3703135.1 DNA replication and repair protein RecF [Victivallaceae bacterium]MDD5663427.1 DNA replication and repair protein RecF [Victivallaceae bacterium]NLK83095.1 DNA replication/repair protein RecF [Lentisphaerota bacterium]
MIKKIYLEGFRNYNKVEISFNNKVNLLIGNNGQGKTNLLEALFFTGMLRSFRTIQLRELKSLEHQGFLIKTQINHQDWIENLEINYINNKRNLKIDEKSVYKSSEFIKRVKPVVFSPDDQVIIKGNSINRRRFIDFLISLLEPEYIVMLQHYSFALKSRNIILKNNELNIEMIKAYEPLLAESGAVINNYREKYCSILSKSINRILNQFYQQKEFTIKYKPLYKCFSKETLLERFELERERDFKRGFSSFGPQTDEFDFLLDNKLMRSFASNGQCRLIALCLKMSSVELLATQNDKDDIIVLVDDVTGDLDKSIKETFFSIMDYAGQVFFTFTEKPDEKYFKNGNIYNIRNGKIF